MSYKLDVNLSLTTERGGSYNYGKSTTYTEIFEITQTVDNTNGFISLASFAPGGKAASTLEGAEAVVIHNPSQQVAELDIMYDNWRDDSGDKTSGTGLSATNLRKLLRPGEYIYLPSVHGCAYEANTSAAFATTVTGAPNTDNESPGNISNVTNIASATTKSIEPADMVYFIGDRIKVNNEIMIVEDVGSSTLTVERGAHGTTAATHTSGSEVIELVHFNHLYDEATTIYGSSVVAMTDGAGNFECSNFFGYGRATLTTGLVKGSVALTFYTQRAYHEIAFTNPITLNSDTKLTGGNTYQIAITVDDSAETELAFTVDTTNTKFGGKNGVIEKIQTAINDASVLGSGGLDGFGLDISIVKGKLRFTSTSHMYPHDGTNGSKVLMNQSASYSGTKVFGQGIFPAAPNDARPSVLAPESVRSKD